MNLALVDKYSIQLTGHIPSLRTLRRVVANNEFIIQLDVKSPIEHELLVYYRTTFTSVSIPINLQNDNTGANNYKWPKYLSLSGPILPVQQF